jgi:hypothetical protein
VKSLTPPQKPTLRGDRAHPVFIKGMHAASASQLPSARPKPDTIRSNPV